VKKLACHPDVITFKDFNGMNVRLQPDEKSHVALLAIESRKQACLLYGLHAIMKFMAK